MKKVLMFSATWCGPCRQAKPVFNQLKESITSGIVWGTKKEVYDYVFNQEANRWYFHEEDWVGIRKEIMEILA